MKKKEFIAELATDLKQFDESGLIDYRSVSLWLQLAIKRFGNNVTVPTEAFLRVENGKTKLPENFWKLNLAVKCDPHGYTVESGEPANVISNFAYKTRLEQDYEWNNQITSYVKKDFKYITEKVYIDSNIVSFHYKSPTILKLTKGMKRDSCMNGCPNLQAKYTHSSPYEINILNNYIQTNFSKGYIYIQYEGMPVDEEGELVIPDTPNGHLFNYLMYHCKAKILETLMGNGDEPNLITMYQLYSQKEREFFSLAETETKFAALGHDWDKKLKNKMRASMLAYERMFPNR